MKSIMKRIMNKKNKGFTLIELIIVIAILGILALLIVPRVTNFTDRAKEVADQQAAESLRKTLMILEVDSQIKMDKGEIVFTGDASGLIDLAPTGTITSKDATKTVQELLQENLAASLKLQKYTKITITVDASGNLTAVLS